MKILYLSIILGIIVLISVPTISAQSETNEIPSWIKEITGTWVNNQVDDATFIELMTFLIENNIIQIENPLYMAMPEESEMVTSLNKMIDDLHIKNDEIEKSKDDLEKEFIKKESETQSYYEEEIEKNRVLYVEVYAEKENLKEANDLLNSQKTSLENTIENLQNEITELKN